ncbi:hypothetical protein EW146_g2385 [Bondarzewia mesenterica]|uniref:Protein kinase domain-containing protein n=1 Tax=Bondarzewia mesenterica TaxID=1095465 RepID=A0A4S4M6Z0_9AGAM|nr:hypothetical protein EW146_g2385 [Bondarzewia mesenterica]
MFTRGFKDHGLIKLSTYLIPYHVGDIVDIKANAAQQKGMPHKYYHGRTGIVYNVTPHAVGVIVYKVVGNRYLEKRVNIRVEHIKHSKCRQEFLDRVKRNTELHAEAKAKGANFPKGLCHSAQTSRIRLPAADFLRHYHEDIEGRDTNAPYLYCGQQSITAVAYRDELSLIKYLVCVLLPVRQAPWKHNSVSLYCAHPQSLFSSILACYLDPSQRSSIILSLGGLVSDGLLPNLAIPAMPSPPIPRPSRFQRFRRIRLRAQDLTQQVYISAASEDELHLRLPTYTHYLIIYPFITTTALTAHHTHYSQWSTPLPSLTSFWTRHFIIATMRLFLRDVHPANILCTEDGSKLSFANFELATTDVVSDDFGSGEPSTMSPECLGQAFRFGEYSTRHSDIWSLGIVLCNMLTGCNPWGSASTEDDEFVDFIHEPEFFCEKFPLSREANDLLRLILALNPLSRISLAVLRREVEEIGTFFMTADEVAAGSASIRRWVKLYGDEIVCAAPIGLDGIAGTDNDALPTSIPSSPVDPEELYIFESPRCDNEFDCESRRYNASYIHHYGPLSEKRYPVFCYHNPYLPASFSGNDEEDSDSILLPALSRSSSSSSSSSGFESSEIDTPDSEVYAVDVVKFDYFGRQSSVASPTESLRNDLPAIIV